MIEGTRYVKRWQVFHNWEIEDKKKRLRNLSVKEAFQIFNDLYELLEVTFKKDIEKLRNRKLQYLFNLRKNLDAVEK